MTLRIRHTTDVAELEARSALTATVWGNKLTPAQYLERERLLASTAFARRGLRTWLLEEGGAVLASCETYAMTSALDGVRGTTHGIASVFVEPALRGRGYARDLLAGVLDLLRREGAHAAHLFSEVGTKLYASLGFESRPFSARRWPADGGAAQSADVFASERVPRVVPERLLAAGAAAARAARFRIVLNHDQLEWHQARARAYHRFLAPERLSPDELRGASTGSGWILWFADYRLDRLLTLACDPGGLADAAALVQESRRAAHRLGFSFFEHWESPAVTLPGGTLHPLDDEIPMLRSFSPSLSPPSWTDYGRACWI